MSKYNAYKNRINASGTTLINSVRESTKRQQISYFMHSPSLSYVFVENENPQTPCIVSNKDSYRIRKFLFLPDYQINNGKYITHENLIYLVTDINMNDIYPEAVGELCNETLKLSTGKSERVQIGKDDFGRPIYDVVETYDNVPCVSRTKYYAETENAAIPLPVGSMIMKIPYKADIKIPLNYIIEKREQKYQVTNVSYESVLNEVGYIEINLQRVVTNNGN